MARKAETSSVKSAPKREVTVKTVKPRNTTVPPKASAKPAARKTTQSLEVTHEMIAERAYHLWLSGATGGEFDHWCAAERELRGK